MKGRDRGCSEQAMGLMARSFLMNMVEERRLIKDGDQLQLWAPLHVHMCVYRCTFTHVHTDSYRQLHREEKQANRNQKQK